MAFSHGSKAKVYVNGYNMSPYFNSMDMDLAADEADASTFGDTFKQVVLGLQDAHLSASGLFDGSAGASDAVLEAALGTITTLWCYLPIGDADGNPGYAMKAADTSYKISTPVSGVAAITTAAHSVVGKERMIILHALAAETTTGDGTVNDNLALTSNGGSMYYQATDFSGTNATVKVQHSSDNVTFADLATFTQITAANQAQRVTFAGTVNRYTKTVLAGTLTSTTFFVGLHRA